MSTGDASSRLVEAYRLHPNATKALARSGQGYSLSDEGLAPVVYPMLPPTRPKCTASGCTDEPLVKLSR